MNKQRIGFFKRSAPAFTMALFVLMLGCIMLLVVFGSGLYGKIVYARESNSSKRACLSYVSQRVRAQEEQGAIKIAKGPQGDALILQEISAQTGCEIRIYLYDGALVEEYAFTDSAFSPENSQEIAKTTRFDVKIKDGELLVITAEGAVYLNLHVKEALV